MVNRSGIVIGVLGTAFTLCASAQTDNVVEVENDYQPTVKDADKINTLPEIEETRSSHYIVNYTTTAIPTDNYTFQPMWAARNKKLIRSDRKGFVTLGYGNNSNARGRLTYGFDLTEDDKLNFDFSTRGHKGDVDGVNENGEWNSRFFTNRFRADYEHHIDSLSSLIVTANYGTDVFNYQPSTVDADRTDKQRNSLFDATVRLTPLSTGKFFIGAEASISTFGQKYVTNVDDEYAETLIGGSITPGFKTGGNLSFDVSLNVDHSSYGIKTMKGYTLLSASPHLRYSSEAVDMKVGAYVNTDKEIAPDVDLVLHMSPQSDIYVRADGGIVLNSFSRLSQMSPYWTLNDAQTKVKHQFDQLRACAGIVTRPVDGLFVDLRAGYDISKRRAEIAGYMMKTGDTPLVYSPVVFEDGKRFYGELDLEFNHRNVVVTKLNAQYNSWSSDYECPLPQDNASTKNYDKIESWRPLISAEWSLEVRPVTGFAVGVDLLYESFKKYDNLYDRPTTIDLGASLSYTFPCRLSIYAKGDNLLNRKYDQYMMYGSPGMNFLSGVAYTF